MKKRFLFLLLFFAALPAFAQQWVVSAPLSASASSCEPSTNVTACIFLTIDPKWNSVGVEVAGTYSGTLQFEGKVNATWVNVAASPQPSGTDVNSTTSTGTWLLKQVGGYSVIRVRFSAYASGVATVSLNPSQAVIASTGGGGSGTVSNCASAGLPYYNTSGTTVICDPNITLDGSGNLTTTGKVTAGTAGGSPGFVDKTAGYLAAAMAVQSSATCTNVTNMTWNIAANKNYILSCHMPVLFVASAQIQWCLNGPGAGPTSTTITAKGATTTASAFIETDMTGATLWSGTNKTAVFASPGAVARVYDITAMIQNGATASGTALTLQTAGNGINNIQVLADTACTLTQAN